MAKKKFSRTGRTLRALKPAGGNPGPLYRGERAGPADIEAVRNGLPEQSRKLTIRLLCFAVECTRTGSSPVAYQNLYPGASYKSAIRRGWGLMKEIEARLGGQEATNDFFAELAGMTLMNIRTRIVDAMGATIQRDFVLPRTGEIVSTPPVPDHAIRLQAATLAAKILKVFEDGGNQPIHISITQFSTPDAPRWPGSPGSEPLDISPDQLNAHLYRED